MRLYLDEDSAASVLVAMLRRGGHDVEVGQVGDRDPEVLRRAIMRGRVLLSHNHDDFRDLHDLLVAAMGHHPGILVVRKDNDPSRDLSIRGITLAIEKLEQSGLQINDEFHILNQWR
jgi:predicted nuclease of predicted toxin-antitoxin system